MKINIIRGIIIILLLMTCSIIFGFSNQNGEESSGISRKITELITKNIKEIQNLEEEQKEIVLNKIEKIIRKIAHFSIYTVIGILLMTLMYTYKIKEKIKVYLSLFLGILYASLDEIHQLFIQGRSAQITDVFIDTMGVILGILLVMLIQKIIYEYILNKKDSFRKNI